jgi:hypothetical protein
MRWDRTCSSYKGTKKHEIYIIYSLENLFVFDQLGEFDLDKVIILKRVLEKLVKVQL